MLPACHSASHGHSSRSKKNAHDDLQRTHTGPDYIPSRMAASHVSITGRRSGIHDIYPCSKRGFPGTPSSFKETDSGPPARIMDFSVELISLHLRCMHSGNTFWTPKLFGSGKSKQGSPLEDTLSSPRTSLAACVIVGC